MTPDAVVVEPAADGRGSISVADHDVSVPRLGVSLAGLTLRQVERRLIFDTLERTRNNRTQAARLLGISIRTLRNKLAAYRGQGFLGPGSG